MRMSRSIPGCPLPGTGKTINKCDKLQFEMLRTQRPPCVKGAVMAPFGCHDWGIDNPDRGLFGRQLPAGNPVAALTVHWTVIHYRDCASLTLYTREALAGDQ